MVQNCANSLTPFGGDTEQPAEQRLADCRDRIVQYLKYMPGYFVGKQVYRKFEATSKSKEGVYRGKVVDYDDDSSHANQFLWGVEYEDGFTEDYDENDMIKYGIDCVDGKDCIRLSGKGKLQRRVAAMSCTGIVSKISQERLF